MYLLISGYNGEQIFNLAGNKSACKLISEIEQSLKVRFTDRLGILSVISFSIGSFQNVFIFRGLLPFEQKLWLSSIHKNLEVVFHFKIIEVIFR